MSNTRSTSNLFHLSAVIVVSLATAALTVMVTAALTGCAAEPRDAEPDAGMHIVPLDPNGVYAIRSTYSLAAAPPIAAPMLGELAAATDGPDDPARYLIDRMVARVSDGRVQLVAAAVAPYLAAYVQARIDAFAPRLATGVRELADGLNQIARRFGTVEQLVIGADGRARRRITAVRFEPRIAQTGGTGANDVVGVDVALASLGLADIATAGNFALANDRLTLGEHAAELPYGALLRAGFDRAVVGRVVPGAASLDDALVELVDCAHLGAIVSDYVGLGSPELYARACDAALTHVAAEIYERIAATPNVPLVMAGAARVIDLDGDGPVDVIASGTWSGTVGDAPIAFSVFEGSAP
jgi:hypothetical protein